MNETLVARKLEENTHEENISIVENGRNTTPEWYRWLLFTIMLLAAFLDLFQLGQGGYANLYYAVAVRSMATNWHSFFFSAFDANGFVSIDKPPLGFWIQVASVRIFGFSPWSILFPQALAGLFSVLVLAHLVRRVYGPAAALIAAATFALTPIWVVTSRNNTIDSTLVLVLLIATWTLFLNVETGRLRWLLLCALLVGVGFNIKMAQAYLVLPAFLLVHLTTAPLSWRSRLLQLLLFFVVLIPVSLSWASIVDLTPAAQRPYVGSSSANSELYLALFYNGVARFDNLSTFKIITHMRAAVAVIEQYQVDMLGAPSLLRLINSQLGGQIGWLLPFAVLGCVGVRWHKAALLPLNEQQRGLALWGTWFITTYIFFSSAAFFHSHYLVMAVPSLSALTGIGIVTTWRDTFQADQRRWLLPATVVLTTIVQSYLLWPYTSYALWLLPIIVCATLTFVTFHLLRDRDHVVFDRVRVVCLVALLLAPAVWGAIPVLQNRSDFFPFAGAPLPVTPQQQLIGTALADYITVDPAQVQYLLHHQSRERYLVATLDAVTASSIMLQTGKQVMALGGWDGGDTILSSAGLATLIRSGVVHYFLLPVPVDIAPLPALARTYIVAEQEINTATGDTDQQALQQWIRMHCSVVPLRFSTPPPHLLTLYNCV